jgi:hypothetical protein
MMPSEYGPDIRTLEFSRLGFATNYELADVVLARGELSTFRDEMRAITIARFISFLYARTVERWPATWWDAFKERWFPAWAKKRWPVEWTTLKQLVPTLEAPTGHQTLYVAVGGAYDQRLYPHGEQPVRIQPYNLQVPLQQIEDLAMQAYRGGSVPYLDTGQLEQVLQWVHEYKRLEQEP